MNNFADASAPGRDGAPNLKASYGQQGNNNFHETPARNSANSYN